MVNKILFVEGEEDQKFFLSVARACEIKNLEVKCNPRGKGNAIIGFMAAVKLQTSASKNRIGLVIDADFSKNDGGGFSKTQTLVNQRLEEASWSLLSKTNYSGFSTASHKTKDVKAGVWIMPDNLHDGYIENLIIETVCLEQKNLFDYAAEQTKIIANGGKGIPSIPTRKHHIDKAKVGAWLAWNDPPRMSLGAAHSNNLLNFNAGTGSDLCNWLRWLYL